MAHELTFTEGKADMFSVGDTPWHREGTVLATAPSYEEGLSLAGLNFDVEKRRGSYPGNDGQPVDSNGYSVVRVDTGAELGIVTKDYTPISNRDGFAVLKPLLDQGVARLETGGSLRGGADCWLLVKWDITRFGPVVREVFADEVVPFSTLMLNHSGRRGALLGNTPIRIVCANTMGYAETDSISRWETIAHRGDAETKLVEAAEKMWGALIERFEVIAAQYRKLKAATLSPAVFDSLVVDTIVPDPRDQKNWNPDGIMARSVVERYERKRARLFEAWGSGKGHVGDWSAWEAYNGAVEVLDHDRDLFPTRGGVYRTASLLTGVLADAKQRVANNLVAYAEGRN